jgi:transcriptional regulator of heat shock response
MLLLESFILLQKIGITQKRIINMPRYNLNREDVNILLDALQNYLINTDFNDHPNQIVSLKRRLQAKIEDQLPEDYDVWSAFQIKEGK